MDISQLSGQFLGQYELRELLGRGGMGAVYRGYQPTLQREVAIKIILPSLISESDYLERFRREAQTAAQLEHTHIVPVYDYGTHADINFIVMRLLHGGSLAQRLDTQPFLSVLEISNLLDQLARALDHAHSKGIIHRDIKTNNVMYDEHQNAYLVDFGIAKPLHSASANDLTPTDVLIGTPGYMAPELWHAGIASKATDLYALGILIYVTLTRKLPFESPFKHLHEEPPLLQESRSDLPGDLQSVMNKALAKDPELRYQSAGAFARAFKRIVNRSRGSKRGKQLLSAVVEAANTIPPVNPNSTLPLTNAASTGASSSSEFISLKQLRRIVLLFIVIVMFGFFASVVNRKDTTISPTPIPNYTPSTTPNESSVAMMTSTQRPALIDTGAPTRNTTTVLSPTPMTINTPTATGTPTFTLSATRTNTATATQTPSPTPSPTRTVPPTQTITTTPTYTVTPSITPTVTLTPTASRTTTPTTIPETTSFSASLTGDLFNAEHFFAWKAGDIVSITVTTDGFDSVIMLVDSNGEKVAEDDDCHTNMQASCIEFVQLTADDTYILRVDSWNMTSVGTYSVEINYIHRCSNDEPFAIVTSGIPSVNLRRGPSTSHPVIGMLPNRACVAIIGRNTSNSWLKIRTESMRTGWISKDIVQVFGDLETVPIVEG